MAASAEKQTGLKILNPGILTLVQDLGRFGYQHLGLSPGGAADEHAFLWANHLLGNTPNSPALEICVGGLQLQAQVATRLALTGADLQAKLNGQRTVPWRTCNLNPGDQLQFGYPRSGVRAYLAVQGGFQIGPTFGSVATVMRERLGGLDGQGSALKKGDWLPCAPAASGPATGVASKYIPDYNKPLTLRVIEGQQHTLFSKKNRERFYAADYQISNQSDRMGVRLTGEPLSPRAPGIVSEGISFGAVQVPPDGQPIILLKDRQTIGGYPKLGCVFPRDAFSLAQRQPHTRVRFEAMQLEEAQRLWGRFYNFFNV